MEVLSDANVEQNLPDMLEKYLLAHGRLTMKDCTPLHSCYSHIALAIDNLGWDCLLEGRVPHVLIETIHPMLRQYSPRGSIDLWGAKLIKSLISITHKQWLYRNSNVHHVIEGLSSQQQQELTERIRELLKVKKNTLLERHKHFMDVDFNKLGCGTTIARQVWVANVEMAMSVAKIARGDFCTQDSLCRLRMPVPKISLNLRNKETPPLTTIALTGTPTIRHSGTITPRQAAGSARLSKSPYASAHTHRTSPPSSKQISLLPVRIRQTRKAMNRNLRQVFPMATPTTDLRPYDKIVAHLQRLHTRWKT
jgi:hypothetical protein